MSHTLGTAGTDPLGSTFFTDSNFPNNIFGYQFDDLDSAVTGFLGNGDTVAIKSQLFVSLTGPASRPAAPPLLVIPSTCLPVPFRGR